MVGNAKSFSKRIFFSLGTLFLDIGVLLFTVIWAKPSLSFEAYIAILVIESGIALGLLGTSFYFYKRTRKSNSALEREKIEDEPNKFTGEEALLILKSFKDEDIRFVKNSFPTTFHLSIRTNNTSRGSPLAGYPSNAIALSPPDSTRVIGYIHNITLAPADGLIFEQAYETLQLAKWNKQIEETFGEKFKSVPADQVYFVKNHGPYAHIRIIGATRYLKKEELKSTQAEIFYSVELAPSIMGFQENDYVLRFNLKFAQRDNMRQVILKHFAPARSAAQQLGEVASRSSPRQKLEAKTELRNIFDVLAEISGSKVIESENASGTYRITISKVPGQLLTQGYGDVLQNAQFDAFTELTRQDAFQIDEASEGATIKFTMPFEVAHRQAIVLYGRLAANCKAEKISFFYNEISKKYTLQVKDSGGQALSGYGNPTLQGDLSYLKKAGILQTRSLGKEDLCFFKAPPLFEMDLYNMLQTSGLLRVMPQTDLAPTSRFSLQPEAVSSFLSSSAHVPGLTPAAVSSSPR